MKRMAHVISEAKHGYVTSHRTACSFKSTGEDFVWPRSVYIPSCTQSEKDTAIEKPVKFKTFLGCLMWLAWVI